GMANTPDRGPARLQVMKQFLHQRLPVVANREARIMAVQHQVLDRIVRRQAGKQLAVGCRGEAIGVGEENRFGHGLLCRGLLGVSGVWLVTASSRRLVNIATAEVAMPAFSERPEAARPAPSPPR